MSIVGYEQGRKLDKLIAIKIMGWLERQDGSVWEPGRRQDAPVHNVPLYSSDISAAWQVERKMMDLRICLPYTEALKELCKVNEDDVPMTFDLVHASPFLRCVAALNALGHKYSVSPRT